MDMYRLVLRLAAVSAELDPAAYLCQNATRQEFATHPMPFVSLDCRVEPEAFAPGADGRHPKVVAELVLTNLHSRASQLVEVTADGFFFFSVGHLRNLLIMGETARWAMLDKWLREAISPEDVH